MVKRSGKAKACFVDRDGTLNRMVYDETHGLLDSPRRPEQVALVRGAGRFLKELRAMGYLIVVVTNQPGVAKGTMTLRELGAVNRRLSTLLQKDGGKWDALYYCPHHPGSDKKAGASSCFVKVCDCRKPKPGMLLRAADEHGIDLSASWMIGDGLNDVQAAKAAGCRAILLTRLKIEQIERFLSMSAGVPDIIAQDFAAALVRMRGQKPAKVSVPGRQRKPRRQANR